MPTLVSRLQVNQGFLVEVQAVNETQPPNWKCDVFLRVVGDTFNLFLQLRHRYHKVVRVVAPQVVEYKRYWVRLRRYSHF